MTAATGADLERILTLARFLQDSPDGRATQRFYQLIADSLKEAFGYIHFTVLAYDAETRLLTRLYSSNPQVDAVGGRKIVTDSDWSREILQRGNILRRSSRDQVEQLFPHSPSLALGCASVLNIPIKRHGVILGTLNLLGKAEQYDAADLRLATLYAQLAVTSVQESSKDVEAGSESLIGLESV